WLALEYLLQEQSLYRDRALSWLAAYALRSRDYHQQHDPSSPTFAGFEKDRTADRFHGGEPGPDVAEIKKAIQNMDDMLADERLRNYRDVHARILGSSRRRGDVFWAELHGGPRSIYRLAQHLRVAGVYRAFYGDWSTLGHAGDLFQFVAPTR